jgi:two-component system chemotaxis response regulator CheB
MNLRVLVADDSILFRKVIAEALGKLPDIEVVGSAPNGKMAVQRVKELKPDILTLDMEMPEMGGLEVLDALRKSGETVEVIVVSALTKQGGQLTMRALEKGAFDFITKPDTSGAEESREYIRKELAPRMRALGHRLEIRKLLRGAQSTTSAAVKKETAPAAPSMESLAEVSARMSRLSSVVRPEMIVIGVSTGGPNALSVIIPQIPATIGVPILIVQHMPPLFTQSLAESLAGKSKIKVREAADNETAEANTAYIAPGGKQMKLVPGADGRKLIQITDDPPENNCKPAVDYLFRSVANNFPGLAMAAVLTGMGSDGTHGLRLLKRRGCYAIAQNEATCVVYGMPKAVVEAGLADSVLPLDAIASRMISFVREGKV